MRHEDAWRLSPCSRPKQKITEMGPRCHLLKSSCQNAPLTIQSHHTHRQTCLCKSSSRLLVGVSPPVCGFGVLFSLSNTQNCRPFPEEAAQAVLVGRTEAWPEHRDVQAISFLPSLPPRWWPSLCSTPSSSYYSQIKHRHAIIVRSLKQLSVFCRWTPQSRFLA